MFLLSLCCYFCHLHLRYHRYWLMIISSSAALPWLEVPESTGCVGRQRQCRRWGFCREHLQLLCHELWVQYQCSSGSSWECLWHAQHRVFQVSLWHSWNVWRALGCWGIKIVSASWGLLVILFLLLQLLYTSHLSVDGPSFHTSIPSRLASLFLIFQMEITQDPVEGEERCQSQCLVNEECQYRELCCK